jgi:lipopolysaccharide/colanic/teichoic acid biosynthesis glycosyltransferase
MLKRFFDILVSLFGLVVLLPLFICITLVLIVEARSSLFFRQQRVGKNMRDFTLWKFSTMYPESDKQGLLTIGARDTRITPVGYYLRKYKLDELPQLFNVLCGDMSVVGPRPEVRKYVAMYNEEQQHVFCIAPGMTDYASLEYFAESELLAQSDTPEQTYIRDIMPVKLALNLRYIREQGMMTDIRIIFRTIAKILRCQ